MKTNISKPRREASEKKLPCWRLDVRLPAPGTVGKYICIVRATML